MPEFDYALIIPAWNEAGLIVSCIESAQTSMNALPQSGQLIVVDNNSTDNTAQLAAAAGAQVVFEPVNQIARARNAGANAASAYMLVFVDADSYVNPALLSAAIESVQSNRVVGGGALITGDRAAGAMIAICIGGWNSASRLFKLAAGCFVFCRTDAFTEIGGFSQKRYAGEELVLSRRLRRWGKQHDMKFHIITEHRIKTSLRKLDWYTPGKMIKQYLVALLPGALSSKRLMSTWYDSSVDRTSGKNNSATDEHKRK